ncbi:MAG: hypothetical protein IPJ28_10195 [Betaproteobacteria bacterium]|nr:hypothetical protein [Betaproteobacteria bacterium]
MAWAGPSVLPAELDRLQSALESGLRAAGFALDERPFAPHLTLARRTVNPAPEAATAPVAWRVGRFALVRSQATGAAPTRNWRAGNSGRKTDPRGRMPGVGENRGPRLRGATRTVSPAACAAVPPDGASYSGSGRSARKRELPVRTSA